MKAGGFNWTIRKNTECYSYIMTSESCLIILKAWNKYGYILCIEVYEKHNLKGLKTSTAALIRNAKNRLKVHIVILFSLEIFDMRV